MADLDILQSLKWQNILQCLSEVLYSKVDSNYKIEDKCCMYESIAFPGNIKKVGFTTHDFLQIITIS